MPRIPAVPITFGGEERSMIFDYEANGKIQDIAGTFLSSVAYILALRATVWASLRSTTLDRDGRETAHTLSIIQVGEILTDMVERDLAQPGGGTPEMDILGAAIRKARGIAEPEPTADPTPATEAATILPS